MDDLRLLPHMTERVETGPVQFGPTDWPGVFIRGDNAFNYAMHLRGMLSEDAPADPISGIVVGDLLRLLESCIVKPVDESAK